MKKYLLLLLVTAYTAGNAAAQDWKELLTKIATEAADRLTDGKLTEKALVGTWNYTQPGVRFEGEDMLSGVTGTALESTVAKRLETAYNLAGIRAGSCIFTFNDDETFRATVGKYELSGTYAFDASTHVVTLRFAKGKIDLGTMEGHAYIDGRALQLVFPVTKLVNMVSTLGSKISSLSTVTALLDKYKNVYVGFAFQK
ncbi:MAG: DUF4923 family protein [Alistipes senegalensis]|nr:DUF4923 family protein [Bacteroides cellulosilyticus]MCM1351169.1 DUF4923 family protein [Alistipes senegalensis]